MFIYFLEDIITTITKKHLVMSQFFVCFNVEIKVYLLITGGWGYNQRNKNLSVIRKIAIVVISII
jgi:hypothetical protein